MWLKYFALSAISLLLISGAFAQNEAHKKYIEKYKDIAIREMSLSGVPASIKLAQGILESNAGRSELATEANNHFGMKISGNWYGKRYPKIDDETDEYGNPIPSFFRVYDSEEESFADHSKFLKKARYASLFKLKITNYKGWAKGLQNAGYATSKTYASKLIALIERYKLDQFDTMKPSDKVVVDITDNEADADVSIDLDALIEEEQEREKDKASRNPTSRAAFDETVEEGIKVKNDVKYVISRSNESLEDIARRLKYSSNSLLNYNEHLYDSKQRLNPGTLVFIQPKRKNYRGKAAYHIISEGEHLLDIANMYAIKLDALRERNKLGYNEEPAVGEQVKLRGGTVTNKPEVADKNPKITGTLINNSTSDSTATRKLNGRKIDPFGPNSKSVRPDTSFDETLDRTEIPSNEGLIPLDKLDFSLTDAQIYIVKDGDTLYSISRKYNTTVDQLKMINKLHSNFIKEGMELWIHEKDTESPN